MAEAAPAWFMLSRAWVLMKVCDEPASKRATQPIQEGDTAELHGNGTTVDLAFGGEGRVIHRYYTSNKTRSLIGEQVRVLIGVGSRHHSKRVTAVARWYVC